MRQLGELLSGWGRAIAAWSTASPAGATRPEIIELTSGRRVLIGPVSARRLEWFLRSAPQVFALFGRRDANGEAIIPDGIQDLEVLAELERFRDQVILAGVIEPRLGTDPDAGPTPGDFADDDRPRLVRRIMDLSRGEHRHHRAAQRSAQAHRAKEGIVENSTGASSAAEIMAMSRRAVALPSGLKVVVQRVGPDELAGILGHLPDVSALATLQDADPEALARRPETGVVLKAMKGLLLAGVIDPTVGEDPKAGLTVRDFPLEDQLLLFSEILDVSGFTKKAGGKVLPLSGTAG